MSVGDVNVKPKRFSLYGHKRRPLLKLFLIISLVLGVIGAGVIAYSYNWYTSSLGPVAQEGESQYFEVKQGQTSEQIATNLEENGLIRSSTAYLIYLSHEDLRGKLQTGVYELDPTMTAQEITTIIVEGRIARRSVTILPDATLPEIKNALVLAGYSETQATEALEASYDHPVRKYAPKGADLEGYIYPETYIAGALQPPEAIIRLALNELDSFITDERINGFEKQGLTVHEAIILASIIEREANSSLEEQRKIAQVFYRRLDEGINLGADATSCYAAEREGKSCDPVPVNIDSPYNTRLSSNVGLPPGPIGAVTETALEAVANPADTDFLYFVHGDTGQAYFSQTLEEHRQNVNQYCTELCN